MFGADDIEDDCDFLPEIDNKKFVSDFCQFVPHLDGWLFFGPDFIKIMLFLFKILVVEGCKT